MRSKRRARLATGLCAALVVTLTWSPGAAGGAGRPSTAGIVNGDFESGSTGWTIYSETGDPLIYQANDLPVPTHRGDWAAWLGRNFDTASLAQAVAIPAGAPTLVFWYWISSEEKNCQWYTGTADVLVDGTSLWTKDLCTATNTNGWVLASIPLSAYAEQTVLLTFLVDSSFAEETVLYLDDVGLFTEAVYLPLVARGSCAAPGCP